MVRVFIFVLALGAGPQAQTGFSQTTIDSVAWLQGCWTTEGASDGQRPEAVDEQWMAPRGGSMLGMSRTVRDGRLLEFESIVLREQDGRLAYHAHPSGQPGAVFLSISVTRSSALFENPQHDFPQRIGYRRDGDRLVAWIEGMRNGQARRVEFPYRRALCPA